MGLPLRRGGDNGGCLSEPDSELSRVGTKGLAQVSDAQVQKILESVY